MKNDVNRLQDSQNETSSHAKASGSNFDLIRRRATAAVTTALLLTGSVAAGSGEGLSKSEPPSSALDLRGSNSVTDRNPSSPAASAVVWRDNNNLTDYRYVPSPPPDGKQFFEEPSWTFKGPPEDQRRHLRKNKVKIAGFHSRKMTPGGEAPQYMMDASSQRGESKGMESLKLSQGEMSSSLLSFAASLEKNPRALQGFQEVMDNEKAVECIEILMKDEKVKEHILSEQRNEKSVEQAILLLENPKAVECLKEVWNGKNAVECLKSVYNDKKNLECIKSLMKDEDSVKQAISLLENGIATDSCVSYRSHPDGDPFVDDDRCKDAKGIARYYPPRRYSWQELGLLVAAMTLPQLACCLAGCCCKQLGKSLKHTGQSLKRFGNSLITEA